MYLQETGIYDKITRKYYPRDECTGYEWRDNQQPLDLDVMCGVFYLLASGLMVGAICLVVEVCIASRNIQDFGRFG